MYRTRFLSALIALLLVAGAARAGDDIQAVSSLWNDFVSALRRGDYRQAHAMFSPESRLSLPYPEFVREYGPLSAAREMVLAKPDSLSTSTDEDWAEITYSGNNPATGRGFRVGVALVKNAGAWGLVAARNEQAERIEAEARGILRTAAIWRGSPDAPRLLREFLAVGDRKNPVLDSYRFETDGQSFRALPRTKGLRSFHVDAWGMIRPGEFAAAEPLAPMPAPVVRQSPAPAIAPRPQPPPDIDGLPEMSEPPAMNGFFLPPLEPPESPPADFPEPPMPTASRPGFLIRDPEPVALPDTIR